MKIGKNSAKDDKNWSHIWKKSLKNVENYVTIWRKKLVQTIKIDHKSQKNFDWIEIHLYEAKNWNCRKNRWKSTKTLKKFDVNE